MKTLGAATYLPLFDAPSQRASATSRAAAKRIAHSVPTLLAQVLAYIEQHPAGLTDEEVQLGLGMNPSTQRPRRIELQRDGMVAPAGTRKTTSGRKATVWQATRLAQKATTGGKDSP
jgi:hypothetical protein